MSFLARSSAASKPSEITAPSAANAREWWAAESKRLGSDWISIAETVSAVMHRLATSSSARCWHRKFKFDVVAVLKAVTALAEHAMAGTITSDIKRAWAREHAALFPFPPAHEVADHIERCAAFKQSTAELVMFVLGKERVKAGLTGQEDAK